MRIGLVQFFPTFTCVSTKSIFGKMYICNSRHYLLVTCVPLLPCNYFEIRILILNTKQALCSTSTCIIKSQISQPHFEVSNVYLAKLSVKKIRVKNQGRVVKK